MNKTKVIVIAVVVLVVLIGGYFLLKIGPMKKSDINTVSAPSAESTSPVAPTPAPAAVLPSANGIQPPAESPSSVAPTPLPAAELPLPVELTPPVAPLVPPAADNAPKTAENAIGNITIKNFAFDPAVLTVKTGTTIVWTNEDSVPHIVSFGSQTLNQGDSFQFKFDKEGTYDYSCKIHPSMKGQIIVIK